MPTAGADSCISAGPDGAYVQTGIDAAGTQFGTDLEVDSSEQYRQADSTASQIADSAKGLLDDVMDALFGWI